MNCPVCKNQGNICKATVKKTGDLIYICDSCDGMWRNFREIRKDNLRDFEKFMNSLLLPPLWSELAGITTAWDVDGS